MRTTVARICGIELKRLPDLSGVIGPWREDVVWRHNSDYRSWLRVDLDLLSDDIGCPAECASPQAIRNERSCRSVVEIFLGSEVATHCRLHAQSIDQSAGDDCGGNSDGFISASGDIAAGSGPCADALPGVRLVLDVHKFRRRHPEFLEVHCREFGIDSDEL